jgi:hypothetical protein
MKGSDPNLNGPRVESALQSKEVVECGARLWFVKIATIYWNFQNKLGEREESGGVAVVE